MASRRALNLEPAMVLLNDIWLKLREELKDDGALQSGLLFMGYLHIGSEHILNYSLCSIKTFKNFSLILFLCFGLFLVEGFSILQTIHHLYFLSYFGDLFFYLFAIIQILSIWSGRTLFPLTDGPKH